jgi:pimeloyl-ACP methyl ester carboxylesterase
MTLFFRNVGLRGESRVSTDHEGRTIEVRGCLLHLLEGGEGSPILLLHPAGGSGSWMPYHALLARSHRVIAPDHPGFGQSPIAEGVETAEDIAYLYSAMLDELGIDKVTVIGFSFGGWIAAELAVLDPHRIERLILVDAIGLRIAGEPIADQFAMSPEQKIAFLFHDPAVAAGLFPSEMTIDDIMRFYHDDAAFARYAWSPFCANPKLAGRLYRITAPTLVLWGEHDRLVPRAHGELYTSAISNARFEILSGAGHAALLEQPEAGVGVIEKFLAN